MTYFFLIATVFLTTSLFVIFKLFAKFQINTLQAIVVNYFSAFVIGILVAEEYYSFDYLTHTPWFIHGLWIGFIFILFFRLMALGAQKIGVSMTTAANKMSIVIPVIFGILFNNDSHVWYKLLGVGLALVSVYMIAKVRGDEQSAEGPIKWLVPFALFFGGGMIDTALDYVQRFYVPVSESSWFSTVIFLVSGIFGALYLIYILATKKITLDRRSVIAGLLLGVPNYASIYCLLRTIGTGEIDVSVLFPVLNIGAVVLASVVGYFIFKERMTKMNWIGVLLAAFSITLIILEQLK